MHNEGHQLIINTDGTCIGNPGPIGIGGIIRDTDVGRIIQLFYEQSGGYGTNNEAEYLAVIKALKIACKLKPKSIIFQSDSQLVMNQLIGKYGAHGNLYGFYNQAKMLITTLNCPIQFDWIPREQNREADALANAALGTPVAYISEETDEIIFWKSNPDYIPSLAEVESLPVVDKSCSEEIKRINRMGDEAEFIDFAQLRTNGTDRYSRLKIETLYNAVKVRFGDYALQWLQQSLLLVDPSHSRNVFRWAARGLRPDLAMRKAVVDRTITVNTISRLSAEKSAKS